MENIKKFDLNNANLSKISVGNVSIVNDSGLTSFTIRPKYNMTYQTNYALSLKSSVILLKMNFKIHISDAEDKLLNVNGEFEINYDFKVKNIQDWILYDENNEPNKLDKDMVVKLTSIGYSTSRGVIFTLCQGTILSSLVLPIIPNKEIETIIDSLRSHDSEDS